MLDLNGDGKRDRGDVWVLVILGLSIFASLMVIVEVVLRKHIDADTKQILNWADLTLCAIFQGDFWFRFYRHKGRRGNFLRTEWMDFATAIPFIPGVPHSEMFRALRLFKCVRCIRTIRFSNPAKGAFATLVLATIITVFIGSIFILKYEEHAVGGNIKSAADALWWSMVTITTVGYGDRYPVTEVGRWIAVTLIVVGAGLFASLTGYISNMFAYKQREEAHNEISELRKEIMELKELIMNTKEDRNGQS